MLTLFANLLERLRTEAPGVSVSGPRRASRHALTWREGRSTSRLCRATSPA
jgi:hypothetical protein